MGSGVFEVWPPGAAKPEVYREYRYAKARLDASPWPSELIEVVNGGDFPARQLVAVGGRDSLASKMRTDEKEG